jgi:parallel beta-helix repeat protein
VLAAAVCLQLGTGLAKASAPLVVPSAFPTIQSAVDAATAGETIKVLPGTYVEQVSIGKDLTITGSGSDSTIIRAPGTLVAGKDGGNSIVEISGRASVTMSRLAVSGPGGGTCEDGALGSGIRVLEAGHLNLSLASVTHIEDTPVAGCFHSATGIFVGDFPTGSASATVRDSSVSEYQGSGIVILGEGSTATISHNVITGPGRSVSTDGIELVAGAAGTVSHNEVSGNVCAAGDSGCGLDFFTEFQHAGIVAGAEQKTVISHNIVHDNQVGIYVAQSAELSHNTLQDNNYFGLALQDGSLSVSHDRISGMAGGVAVIAASANTQALLDHVEITGSSGAPIQKFECCGFTATTLGWP